MNEKKVDRSGIIFGVILTCLGILFLLNSFNLLSWNIWNIVIRFWPVILVLLGLNLILKNSRLWWLVPILIILLFLGMIFGAPYVRKPFVHHFNAHNWTHSGNYSYSRELNEEIDKMVVDINYKAGEIFVKQTDEEEKLCDLDLLYNELKPVLDYSYQQGTGEARLLIEEHSKASFTEKNSDNQWNLRLNKNIPLFMTLNGGAGKIDLELGTLKAEELTINAGVSDLDIYFNDYSTKTIINSGAANIKLTIPPSTGVKITTAALISKNNFQEAGLIKLSDKLYQSENIGDAEHRIDIEISTSASSIKLFYL